MSLVYDRKGSDVEQIHVGGETGEQTYAPGEIAPAPD
jgi:hypothetical protein